MKFVPFILALTCSTLIYGAVDKAPKCADYFTTHQTDGHYQRMSNGLAQDPLTAVSYTHLRAHET